jgi:predicted Rossmann fold flavoprotein
MEKQKLVVVGGGAAGFFCAVNAARMHSQLEVVLLEKTSKILSKVRVSGGGRCNVTHASDDINEMSQCYPRGRHFVKKCFHLFFTQDTVRWFEERGVPLKTEADGRMFPQSDNSMSIVDCLVKEANQYGVRIMMNAEVMKLEKISSQWKITLSDKRVLHADKLCVASGGYPKSTLFNWLMQTGHSITEPVPSLFTFNIPNHPLTKLMGISVTEARIKITGSKLDETGPLLITHWGLSGPAVLRLSAWGAKELKEKNYHFNILVNWLPLFNEMQLQNECRQIRNLSGGQVIQQRNPFDLPKRFWEYILELTGIKAGTRWSDLTAASQNKLVKNLLSMELEVKGKTTFKEEFVTAGGINVSEIDPQTMMSKKVSDLYFAGEVLDVDGITGGYNFQFAWTSGFIAAKNILRDEIQKPQGAQGNTQSAQ